MIEMNTTPVAIINDKPEIDVLCTSEETNERLSVCIPCPNFTFTEDGNTKCSLSNCNISLMTTFKFKQCPIGKW